jgi:hypothetical protein
MKNLRDQTGGALSGAARCAIAAFAALFALTSGAGRATADDIRPFRLTDISGSVELGFFTSLQDRSRATSQDSNFDRVEFSQLLDLNASAYIYHPSFLTFDGGFEIELIEDVINKDSNRILFGGDWRFNFLQNHRNGLAVFGRVSQSESARPFSETYEVNSQLYGATFYKRWGWVPFSLTYQHREVSSGGSGGFDDSADEVLFNGNYELGEQSRGSIDYDLIFQDLGGNDVRRQDLSVNNISYFGGEGEKRLVTNFLFNEQITERESRTKERYAVGGATNFDWRHTDDLWTEYRLSSRWTDVGTQSVTNVNPGFSITHELYESLTTHVEIFGNLRDGSTGSRHQFGGAINESYRKRLGEWVRLSIRVAPRIAMTYDRPKGDTGEAVDESHQMALGLDARLVNPDVIESTIFVTSENCLGLEGECTPGADYEVIPPAGGGFETLLRVPFGSDILDPVDPAIPVEVLVDYKYELGGKADIRNTGIVVGANLLILERLGLFGRYEINDQKLVSGDERDVRINDYDRSVVGLQLTGPWFSAGAEFENYDATFAPFRGYLGSISVFSDSAALWRARFNARYAFRDHTDTGETVGRLTMSAGVRKRLFRRGELELEGRYRRVRWSGDRGDADDVDTLFVNADFSWRYGKIDVKLEAGMAQVLREAEDKRVYRVDLRVRRSF